MQNRRSNSVAAPDRGRFMPAGQILLFGLLVLVALLAVFPGQRLQQRLESTAYSDPLSLAYLAAWLRAQPQEAQLRLVMARRQLGDGELDGAERTLLPLRQPLAAGSPYHWQAELLHHEILTQRLWKQVPASPEFLRLRAEVLASLDKLAVQDWAPAQLQAFADEALALDATEQAELFLQRLLVAEPSRLVPIRENIARLQLGHGHYREAAASYFLAMDHARDTAERRRLFQAGLAALQSGNLLDEAVVAAEARWQPLADDAETLEFLARLMRSANRLDLAQFYISRLLQQRVQTAAGLKQEGGS